MEARLEKIITLAQHGSKNSDEHTQLSLAKQKLVKRTLMKLVDPMTGNKNEKVKLP